MGFQIQWIRQNHGFFDPNGQSIWIIQICSRFTLNEFFDPWILSIHWITIWIIQMDNPFRSIEHLYS